MRKIIAFRHIAKCLDSLFKKKAFAHYNNLFLSKENQNHYAYWQMSRQFILKEAFAHYTNFSPVRKIKAVRHIGKCLDSLFKKTAFAHNANFSPVRKINAVMHIGKCLDSSFTKKAFAQCLSLKSCLGLHLYALLCHLSFPNNEN